MATFVLGGVIGVVAFERALGFQFANPTVLDWIFTGGVDPAIHFLGWHLFRAEPWSMPPGALHWFGHPIGTSVALTDSIPLAAIGLKTIDAFLPVDFQYFGLWTLSSFVLQGVCGVALVRIVTPRHLLQVLGATLFVLSPVLLHTVGQTAFTTHWLILAVLWLYFRANVIAPFSLRAGLLSMVAVAAAVQPYITAMVLAVALATVLRVGVTRPARVLADTIVTTVLLGGVTFLVWWLSGNFVVEDTGNLQRSGFGLLSMNMLAVVTPPQGGLLFGRIPYPLITSSQQHGSSYLGLGVIVAMVVAVMLFRPRHVTRDRIRQHWPLVVACAGLTLLALSPAITWGPHTILQYDPQWWGPLSIFRTSSRVFWPVYYTIVFASIAAIVRGLPFRPSVVVMMMCVVVQAADVAGSYRLSKQLRTSPFSEPLTNPFWAIVPRHYAHMVMIPTNACAPLGEALDYRVFALAAGRARATINGGDAARIDVGRVVRYCHVYNDERQRGVVRDDTLYVLRADLVTGFQATAQRPVTCVPADGVVACVSSSTTSRWEPEFTAVAPSQ